VKRSDWHAAAGLDAQLVAPNLSPSSRSFSFSSFSLPLLLSVLQTAGTDAEPETVRSPSAARPTNGDNKQLRPARASQAETTFRQDGERSDCECPLPCSRKTVDSTSIPHLGQTALPPPASFASSRTRRQAKAPPCGGLRLKPLGRTAARGSQGRQQHLRCPDWPRGRCLEPLREPAARLTYSRHATGARAKTGAPARRPGPSRPRPRSVPRRECGAPRPAATTGGTRRGSPS